MNRTDTLTKILASTGTVLVWIPLLAPAFFGLVSLLADGVFRFDYLMPAEIFPLALLGGVALIWAALRVRAQLSLIPAEAQIWALLLAVASLGAAQLLAVATGLSSGATPIGGWQWSLVMLLLIVYILSVAGMGVGGLLLLRDLFGDERLEHGR